MKRWMGLMLLGAVLWMGWPSEVLADTCETRLDTDNPDFPVNKPAPVICDTHGQVRTRAGQATTTAPALAEGTITGFSYDLNGNARVTMSGGSLANLGTATDAAPTLAEGVGANFSFDLTGNARVTLGTLISGEDQTNNVLRVEQQFSYALDDADLVVKSAPGFVHTFTCWGEDAAATGGSVELRDATAAGAGTVVYAETFAAAAYTAKTIILDAVFATGIVIDFTTTADVFCTVTYR